ncbi:hypothetical protein, partial [Escherichia coli]|uniref:hypothetical protein n=1 Tax=Escherichia coli TaxID=562 RepID=UPI001954586E
LKEVSLYFRCSLCLCVRNFAGSAKEAQACSLGPNGGADSKLIKVSEREALAILEDYMVCH